MQESRAARADEDTTAVKWTEKVAVSLIKRIHVGRVQVQRLQPQNSTPRLRNTNWRLILIVCVEVEADIWPLYMSVCHWWWYVKERVCVCVGGGAADSSVLTLMWMFLGADRLVLFCGPAVSRSGHNCCPSSTLKCPSAGWSGSDTDVCAGFQDPLFSGCISTGYLSFPYGSSLMLTIIDVGWLATPPRGFVYP